MKLSFLKKTIPFLAAFSLYSSVNEPLKITFFSGYRNDSLHWHLQEGGTGFLTYSEIYRNLQFWENGIDLDVVHRDFFFNARGSYSTFGKGDLSQNYGRTLFSSATPQFSFDTQGWATDGEGSLGYTVELTPDRTYRVLFIPWIGYAVNYERIWSHGSKTKEISEGSLGPYQITSSLPDALHMLWYGLFLGGGFQVKPGGPFSFQGGYSYHWLYQSFESYDKQSYRLKNYPNSSSLDIDTKVHAKGNGNIGHSGWIELDWDFFPWQIGLGSSVRYFSTTLLPADLHLDISGNPSLEYQQKLKVRWTPISLWLNFSRSL